MTFSLKNWNGNDPSDADMDILQLAARTKIRTTNEQGKVIDALNHFVRTFHGMQVSIGIDRSEQIQLVPMVAAFHNMFRKQYPRLWRIYKEETRGWLTIAKITCEQDIETQFNKVKAALDAVELALQACASENDSTLTDE